MEGVQSSHHPHPLISVPVTTRSPRFCPPPSLPLPPRRLPVTKGEKKKRESENDKQKLTKRFSVKVRDLRKYLIVKRLFNNYPAKSRGISPDT